MLYRKWRNKTVTSSNQSFENDALGRILNLSNKHLFTVYTIKCKQIVSNTHINVEHKHILNLVQGTYIYIYIYSGVIVIMYNK